MYVIEWPITFILLNADPGYLTAVVFVRTAYIVGLALFFGAIIFTDDAIAALGNGQVLGTLWQHRRSDCPLSY